MSLNGTMYERHTSTGISWATLNLTIVNVTCWFDTVGSRNYSV